MLYQISLLCLMLMVSMTGIAQGKNTKDSASQANKAATGLKEIMGTPDKPFRWRQAGSGASCWRASALAMALQKAASD